MDSEFQKKYIEIVLFIGTFLLNGKTTSYFSGFINSWISWPTTSTKRKNSQWLKVFHSTDRFDWSSWSSKMWVGEIMWKVNNRTDRQTNRCLTLFHQKNSHAHLAQVSSKVKDFCSKMKNLFNKYYAYLQLQPFYPEFSLELEFLFFLIIYLNMWTLTPYRSILHSENVKHKHTIFKKKIAVRY